MLVIGVRQQPHPGLHGEPLAVLIALVAVEIGAVAALWMPRDAGRLLVVPFVPLAAGSAVLAWLQRGTVGSLGFLILALAAMRILPARRDRLLVRRGRGRDRRDPDAGRGSGPRPRCTRPTRPAF